MSDGVYYRIYRSHQTEEWVPVCMQSFDECDYDQSRFLNDVHYESENEAQAFIDHVTTGCNAVVNLIASLTPEQVQSLVTLARAMARKDK